MLLSVWHTAGLDKCHLDSESDLAGLSRWLSTQACPDSIFWAPTTCKVPLQVLATGMRQEYDSHSTDEETEPWRGRGSHAR